MISLTQLADWWQRFFHEPEPVAALAVFRIAFGLVLVVNGLTLLPYISDFFGPRGLLGVKGLAKAYPSPRLSLFYLLPQTEGAALLVVWAYLLGAVLLT